VLKSEKNLGFIFQLHIKGESGLSPILFYIVAEDKSRMAET
jgi:hypothetical protein